MDQNLINEFFTTPGVDPKKREESMRLYKKSGYAVVTKINKDAAVLDVGCGGNLFKKYFSNLIGIDPVDPGADIKVALLDFKTDQKFDVVICFGSIYGLLEDIKEQIIYIKSMLNPNGKIFWRTSPAKPDWAAPAKIKSESYPDFIYPWTEDTHYSLANELGFTINEIAREQTPFATNEYRIYSEWTLN